MRGWPNSRALVTAVKQICSQWGWFGTIYLTPDKTAPPAFIKRRKFFRNYSLCVLNHFKCSTAKKLLQNCRRRKSHKTIRKLHFGDNFLGSRSFFPNRNENFYYWSASFSPLSLQGLSQIAQKKSVVLLVPTRGSKKRWSSGSNLGARTLPVGEGFSLVSFFFPYLFWLSILLGEWICIYCKIRTRINLGGAAVGNLILGFQR